jgi:hypothetical protein
VIFPAITDTVFPSVTETFVMAMTADEVERRISEGIKANKLIGSVHRGSFSLSANIVRPPQFSPIARGRIESSSRGSLIFLKYELFPATKMLLAFISIGLLIATVVAAIEESAPLYPISALVLVWVFRTVALTNIRIHRTPVRQDLLEVLS